jgi:hypothetical protein
MYQAVLKSAGAPAIMQKTEKIVETSPVYYVEIAQK